MSKEENPFLMLDDALANKRSSRTRNKLLGGTQLKKPRKPRDEKEQREQIALFIWARQKSTLLKYPLFDKLLFAVPNGGKRSIKVAGAMKAEGQESGVSDILFLVPSRGFHYLSIEMKAPSKKQSANQKDFEAEVDKVGGLYQVCFSEEEARKLLEWYYADIKL